MRLGGPGKYGRLSGAQIGDFRGALLDAFSTLARFDEMLLVYAERPRQLIALGDSLEEIALRVIARSEDESWTAELLKAGRLAAPSNEALQLFAQPFGMVPAAPSKDALQHTIKAANGELEVLPWRMRLGQIEGQVCRVEVPSAAPPDYGTGFLVGPDLVMTNYHVLENVLVGLVKPEAVTLRFDHKVLADGTSVGTGTVHRLAPGSQADWLRHASPYSQADLTAAPAQPPGIDELDFVLLKLASAAGKEPVGAPQAALANPRPRRWVPVPRVAHEFRPHSSVFILQHPDGQPLKLTLDTDSVQGVNANGTRVRYETNTRPGSSGSPCFDANWNLIALHHVGDPRYSKLTAAQFNQGIPVAAIVDALRRAGRLQLLDAPAV